MVGGEFDGPLVDGGEELLGEGDFGHDGLGEGRVERFQSRLVVERQIGMCCMGMLVEVTFVGLKLVTSLDEIAGCHELDGVG